MKVAQNIKRSFANVQAFNIGFLSGTVRQPVPISRGKKPAVHLPLSQFIGLATRLVPRFRKREGGGPINNSISHFCGVSRSALQLIFSRFVDCDSPAATCPAPCIASAPCAYASQAPAARGTWLMQRPEKKIRNQIYIFFRLCGK